MTSSEPAKMTARSRRMWSCSIGGLKVEGALALATVRDWLQTRIGLSPEGQTHLLVTVIVIVGLWIIERLILAIVYRRVTDPWKRSRWRTTMTYLTLGHAVLVSRREGRASGMP